MELSAFVTLVDRSDRRAGSALAWLACGFRQDGQCGGMSGPSPSRISAPRIFATKKTNLIGIMRVVEGPTAFGKLLHSGLRGVSCLPPARHDHGPAHAGELRIHADRKCMHETYDYHS